MNYLLNEHCSEETERNQIGNLLPLQCLQLEEKVVIIRTRLEVKAFIKLNMVPSSPSHLDRRGSTTPKGVKSEQPDTQPKVRGRSP